MTTTPAVPRPPGMFAFLVPKLSVHPENVATAALQYVLSTSPAAARALEDYLQRVTALPTGLHYDTQSPGEDGSIPDLIGTAADGSTPLLAEAKFYAPLTGNQPVSYLRRLPAGRPGLLLFIVPSHRLGLLWTEVRIRAVAADFPVTAVRADGDFRHASVGAEHVLGMTSWRSLLNVLTDAVVAADDLAAASNLGQLRGLCDRMDSEAFYPLAAEELSGSVAVRLRQYTGLIEKSVADLIDADVATRGTSAIPTPTPGRGEAYWGIFFGLEDVMCFLHVSARSWAKDRATPLWLQVGHKNQPPVEAVHAALAPMNREANRVFRRRYCVDVAIDLPTGVEETEVVAAITGQIRRIATHLTAVRSGHTGATGGGMSHSSGMDGDSGGTDLAEEAPISGGQAGDST